MSTRRKLLIGLGVVAVAAAIVYANFRFRRNDAKTVSAESVQQRNLEAIVSASGTIQPKRLVNISADVMGRVTELAVEEGQTVKQGQFLLQIDPRNLQSAFERGQASVAAADAQLQQLRTSVFTAQEQLALARDTLRRQRELWSEQLTTKEALDRAETEVKVREADVRERTQQVTTQERRIQAEKADLANARYNLSKVRIESPIDGIVTRRNIEQGEMVVIGTMNNAGTVMLTIADMSVIEAEVEVDETDIPSIRLGQIAKVTIDALPDRSFSGKVTEIGNSPIQTTTSIQTTSAGQQATNFKVVVTLEGRIPEVRPGFTCTAEITTATRQQTVSVPIQAMAVREMVYDKDGKIVRKPREERRRGRSVEPTASAQELPPGQTRKETEGVFVVRGDTVEFVPVKTGIAGDKYFEVLSGLKAGDRVVTGPFASVRDLQDGDRIKLEERKTERP
jgi:HlyD family secretion protein